MDPEHPEPELSEKSDPEPDPEIIFSAPTHCLDVDPEKRSDTNFEIFFFMV